MPPAPRMDKAAGQAARGVTGRRPRRRSDAPTAPSPTIISAQLLGSGTADTAVALPLPLTIIVARKILSSRDGLFVVTRIVELPGVIYGAIL